MSGNLYLYSCKHALFSWSKTKDPFQNCFAHYLVYLFAKVSVHFSAFKPINYPTDVKGIDSVPTTAMAGAIMNVKSGVKRDG